MWNATSTTEETKMIDLVDIVEAGHTVVAYTYNTKNTLTRVVATACAEP